MIAALTYALLGWRVFAVYEPTGPGMCSCARGAACGRDAGKHPRTAHGHLDATTDEATIRSWWTRWPKANIGLATGRGILAVDVDGDDGARSLSSFPDLPATVEQSTGRGRHLLFRVPGTAATSKGRLGLGIDTRGDGGYVVLAPSLHASGRRYEWVKAPGDAELADAPVWLLEALVRRPCASSPWEACPAEGAQGRAFVGSDPTDSGKDWRNAVAMIRRGATRAEVATMLRTGPSYAHKRSHRSAENYVAHTIRKACALVESTPAPDPWARAVRARILRAVPEPLPAKPWTGQGRETRVRLELVTTDGEVLPRQYVVAPTHGHEAARAVYEAVLGDFPPDTWDRPDAWTVARQLVGRDLEVVMGTGRRAARMRAARNDADVPSEKTGGK